MMEELPQVIWLAEGRGRNRAGEMSPWMWLQEGPDGGAQVFTDRHEAEHALVEWANHQPLPDQFEGHLAEFHRRGEIPL